jgi:hypothetical protein
MHPLMRRPSHDPKPSSLPETPEQQAPRDRGRRSLRVRAGVRAGADEIKSIEYVDNWSSQR